MVNDFADYETAHPIFVIALLQSLALSRPVRRVPCTTYNSTIHVSRDRQLVPGNNTARYNKHNHETYPSSR